MRKFSEKDRGSKTSIYGPFIRMFNHDFSIPSYHGKILKLIVHTLVCMGVCYLCVCAVSFLAFSTFEKICRCTSCHGHLSVVDCFFGELFSKCLYLVIRQFLKKRCIVKKYRPFSLNEWSDFETAVSLVISKSLVQVYIEDFRKLNTYFSRHFRHPFRSYFTTQNSFSQLFIFGIAKIWNSTSNSCLILCICVLKFFIYTWIILVKETYFILHVRM